MYPSHSFISLILPLVGFPSFPMSILFIIHFPINFDFVVVYYPDDGPLELGPEMYGLVAYHGNVLLILGMS